MDRVKNILQKMLEEKQKPLTPTYERIFFNNYENAGITLNKDNLKEIWEESERLLLLDLMAEVTHLNYEEFKDLLVRKYSKLDN